MLRLVVAVNYHNVSLVCRWLLDMMYDHLWLMKWLVIEGFRSITGWVTATVIEICSVFGRRRFTSGLSTQDGSRFEDQQPPRSVAGLSSCMVKPGKPQADWSPISGAPGLGYRRTPNGCCTADPPSRLFVPSSKQHWRHIRCASALALPRGDDPRPLVNQRILAAMEL